jgi:hypothetical protein
LLKGEQAQSLGEDVAGGVDVTVMGDAAVGAGPVTDPEPSLAFRAGDGLAGRAGLGGGVEPPHLDDGPALSVGLFGDQPQELGHRLVVNGFCQVGAGHAGHGQGLDGDDVVGGNNFGGLLVSVIQAGFPNLAVQDGNPDFGFGPVPGSFLLEGYPDDGSNAVLAADPSEKSGRGPGIDRSRGSGAPGITDLAGYCHDPDRPFLLS